MTEIGQWTEIDPKKELQNHYKYFEPVRLPQPVEMIKEMVEEIPEKKQAAGEPKETVILPEDLP